ncbi:MFS transporter [Pectobacterium punjabense]|uniref:MFS transporter n=1 Tax=Pectobacterium punjabense TaxID=2108399 RepID=UPI00311EBBCF
MNASVPSPQTVIAHQWRALTGICIASFLGCIDFTIVNTAIPAIQQQFGAGIAHVQWVMGIFIMALCTSMVIVGRVADRVGRRRVLYIGMAVFGVASLGAGLSGSVNELIGWRFLQGASCAVLYTATTVILVDIYPAQHHGRVLGILFAVNGLGLAIGPVAGGLLVDVLGWRWVFLLNVPLIAVSFVFCLGQVRESRVAQAPPLDGKGLLFFILSVASALLVINQGDRWGWLSLPSLACFLLAVVALGGLIRVERREPFPLIDLDLLRQPAFLRICVLTSLLAFFYCGAFFLMPIHLHATHHYRDAVIGLLLLPTTAAMALISPWVGRLADRIGPRWILMAGFLMLGLSAGLQSMLDRESALGTMIVAFTLMGVGWGCILGPSVLAALKAVHAEQQGVAIGISWTLHNLGGAVGLAFVTQLYHRTEQGYQTAMLLLCFLSLLGCLIASYRDKRL